MRFPSRTWSPLLLFSLLSPVAAVFQDEVGDIDFHHQLIGVPQTTTTFFHRPRKDDKASLLYTLSDVGALGAINPGTGAVVWRQLLTGNITNGGGFLRAGEGENWVSGAYGQSVHSWNALSGRNIWWMNFNGEVRDLEVMELTETERKDVLVLFKDGDDTIVRRLHSGNGHVIWEFKESAKDIPLQVSTNIAKVFVVSLQGSSSSYGIKVTVLDTRTGKRLDEIAISTKGDVRSEEDVMFVGANSAAPIVAWTDESLSKIKINVLGSKTKQEFPLPADSVDVDIHAPHQIQAEPHFLVHSRTKVGNRADVYHIDLKSHAISKAYDLPHLPGLGAFATSSDGANVYFTRITEEEVIVTSSRSHGILGRWPFQRGTDNVEAIHGVSEVIKRGADSYAVRSAVTTSSDDWIMVRSGEVAWSRPEGMSGAVAAAWAEIPESEELAKTLEQEAHINPLSAYIHRLNRHMTDLQNLPDYLASIPQRLLNSILGTENAGSQSGLTRDAFGFNKIVILATRRGRLYGIDTAHQGKIIWSQTAFKMAPGEFWDVKGMFVEDAKALVTVRGAAGEYVILKTDSGKLVEEMPPGSWPPVESAVVVDSDNGQWLLPVGKEGKVGNVPAKWSPKQTVVVRGPNNELRGLVFVDSEGQASETIAWTFSAPAGYDIKSIATRPAHDAVASIGRVMGDRNVLYKYLNPNTIVLAAANSDTSKLVIILLDTVSGQVLGSSAFDGVDADKSVSCALSENWFTCTFFGQYNMDNGGQVQTIKGYQVTVTDLYESAEANDRGPLGDAVNFSSLDPVDLPTGPPLPSFVSQTWVLSAPLGSSLAVTSTRQGITSRQVLAYLPESHAITGIPRMLLEPRRPVGRDVTPQEAEAEGLIKYLPVIELDPRNTITHELDVIGIEQIITTPAIVESTSLVFAYGIDVFGTRVAPSFAFDTLGKGFDKLTLIGTVLALTGGVMVLRPMVRYLHKSVNCS
jgi:ER membrane protein complex subunit 1